MTNVYVLPPAPKKNSNKIMKNGSTWHDSKIFLFLSFMIFRLKIEDKKIVDLNGVAEKSVNKCQRIRILAWMSVCFFFVVDGRTHERCCKLIKISTSSTRNKRKQNCYARNVNESNVERLRRVSFANRFSCEKEREILWTHSAYDVKKSENMKLHIKYSIRISSRRFFLRKKDRTFLMRRGRLKDGWRWRILACKLHCKRDKAHRRTNISIHFDTNIYIYFDYFHFFLSFLGNIIY